MVGHGRHSDPHKTPLWLAVGRGMSEIVTCLLERVTSDNGHDKTWMQRLFNLRDRYDGTLIGEGYKIRF